uniref:Uncharacterized protein n=1 Tax=Solibacter usitatus (strain Ellin6076) TaxID=234267 RepID=Q023T1_SOLUE
MRKLFYTMEVKGRTSRPSDPSEPLRTTGSATSCDINTVISAAGIQTEITHSAGELAFFESELRMVAPQEYEETGEIAFGDHLLKFSTMGSGHISPDIDPGMIAGAAAWKVEGGEGQFAGARGFITSSFTITPAGDRCDIQCAMMFLPD